MELSNSKMSIVLLLVIVVVTAHANYLALPRMGRRSGYIAFPRLGRGFPSRSQRAYLALPRMGRSQGGSDVNEPDCCMPGLKTEWLLDDGGRTRIQNVCVADACCDGLTEVLDQKPDGAFYSMCIPVNDSTPNKLTDTTVNV